MVCLYVSRTTKLQDQIWAGTVLSSMRFCKLCKTTKAFLTSLFLPLSASNIMLYDENEGISKQNKQHIPWHPKNSIYLFMITLYKDYCLPAFRNNTVTWFESALLHIYIYLFIHLCIFKINSEYFDLVMYISANKVNNTHSYTNGVTSYTSSQHSWVQSGWAGDQNLILGAAAP